MIDDDYYAEAEDDCAATGHDTFRTFEYEDGGYDWRCYRCGAEGWEDIQYD